jgi:predicted RNase H-like HicB family nuclease
MFDKYTVILFWSELDHCYLAQIPDLPGAFADGTTYEEALTAIKRVGEMWISTAREDGIAIPCPKPHSVPELELV